MKGVASSFEAFIDGLGLGNTRGVGFEPLYKNVPRAALRDPAIYQLLALVDAIRDGRARAESGRTRFGPQDKVDSWPILIFKSPRPQLRQGFRGWRRESCGGSRALFVYADIEKRLLMD